MAMKMLTLASLAAFIALPVQASEWFEKRPQFEIPEQLAQATPSNSGKRTANTGIYDEALEHRRQIERSNGVSPGPDHQQPTYLAQAQPDAFGGRIYIAGALSAVFIGDAELGSTNASTNALVRSAESELEFDTGWGASGALGWRFLPVDDAGIRLELEAAYQQNDVGRFNTNVGSVTVDADASVFSLMTNFLLDIYTDSPWLPYFGAGLGYSWVDAELSAGAITEKANDIALTGQFIGGLAYALTDTSFLTLDYRLMVLDELEYGGGTLKPRIHKVSLGMRHQF